MVKEAEENADADAKKKEEIEVRNEADQLVFQTEKTSISSSERPEEDLIVMFCSFPVPKSFALTFTIPFLSISKETSI